MGFTDHLDSLRPLSPLSPFTACIITKPLFASFYIGISQLAEFILSFIYHLFIYIYITYPYISALLLCSILWVVFCGVLREGTLGIV